MFNFGIIKVCSVDFYSSFAGKNMLAYQQNQKNTYAMKYLGFDKAIMTNLEESLQREILRTNNAGAYHCTTIVDCNTRKYHGLLVIPIPQIDDENYVLLSSLDETVIQHGAEFNLGLHKYSGDNYSPNGHKYIREFDCETIPATLYRVGGVILKKEKIFVYNENRILIKYTLLEAHSDTIIRLKPFLAFRSVREYTHENSSVNKSYTDIENGIKTCMYSGYPELYMQMNKECKYIHTPDWYRGIEYSKEQERGYHFSEDLYVPGYFETKIKKGESIIFSAGISEVDTKKLSKIFDEEVEERTPRNNFLNCLENSAHQFHNVQGDDNYIIAGYPWFKCRARDMFVSLPGITLAIDEQDKFEKVMNTAEKAIRNFIEGKPIEYKIYEIEQPDVLLWAVWAIQQYSKEVSRKDCFNRYGTLLKDILEFIREGKHQNIRLHDNGLLYIEGKEKAATWMNAMANGKPVTPRTGYVVEINALWYNTLKFVAELILEEDESSEYAKTINNEAEKTKDSFVKTFLNQYGYLLDYVDGNMMDWSVRPNMIFAVALDYSPLELSQRKKVVDVVTKELLTPKGIRTLSPQSMGYNPNYVGKQSERDYAYHQGTAWPWLMGFYMEAYLKVYRMSGLSFVERHLIGLEDELTQHCVGSISELYDGNPPFQGRGAVSFAMNVAETLRILKLISRYY